MNINGISASNIVLNGSARVVSEGIPDTYRMPAFRAQLSDREIAEVLNFVRHQWGNQGEAVTEKEVHSLRSKSAPASTDVEVLRMH